MKITLSVLLAIIVISWLFYGINPFTIFFVTPALWIVLGAPVILVTFMKGIVPSKLNALFVSSVLFYLGQIIIFGFSFTIDGLYDFAGHGASDPFSVYWLYAIQVAGLLSIFSYLLVLYVRTWKNL